MRKLELTRKLLLLLLAFTLPALGFAQFKVVAYLPTWLNPASEVKNIDLGKVTHVNIAFANPNNTGSLVPADGTTDADVKTIADACHAKGVKVFMSIGGAGAPGDVYASQFKSTATLTNLAKIIQSYATLHNLDGIDVDIEGDVLDGATVTAIQYESFVSSLGSYLHANNLEMSAALAPWFGQYITSTAAAQFDWINMMSYDAAIPPSDPAGPHAPFSLVTSDYTYWTGVKGVPANKIIVGIPFYGYAWGTYASTNSEMGYCSIVTTYSGAENNDQVGSGKNAIYYNGIPTVKEKTKFARENAAGVMVWEVTEDCPSSNNKSLLLAIDQVVHAVPTSVDTRDLSWQSLKIFPNPINDKLNVQLDLPDMSHGTLLLIDLNGRVLQILAEGALPNQSLYQCSMSDLHPGIYFLKLESEQGMLVRKIIK